jgi:hypothetical protein
MALFMATLECALVRIYVPWQRLLVFVIALRAAQLVVALPLQYTVRKWQPCTVDSHPLCARLESYACTVCDVCNSACSKQLAIKVFCYKHLAGWPVSGDVLCTCVVLSNNHGFRSLPNKAGS